MDPMEVRGAEETEVAPRRSTSVEVTTMKMLEIKTAKEFAASFFGDPILKMAFNAAMDNAPTVDAVPVDKFQIHYIKIDQNGIPEVKLQFGERTLILRNEDEPVDVREVAHGRWVLAKPRVKGRNATYRCTVCGKLRSSYYNDVFQWEYCPCGAKMDGGTDHET